MNPTPFLNSSLGKKYLTAVTGLLLAGFLISHLTGNLLIYVGPEALNEYAHKLKTMPIYALVWGARTALLTFFLVHLISGVRLTLQNKGARPVRYKGQKTKIASISSRTMIWSGIVIALFVAYHLAHFTLHWTSADIANLSPYYDPSALKAAGGDITLVPAKYIMFDVYTMVVMSFQNIFISLLYIASMFALWFHLCHGTSSVFQTLGANFPKIRFLTNLIGPAFATVLLVGNCSIPIAVLSGIVGG